jgi:hypothetical protein
VLLRWVWIQTGLNKLDRKLLFFTVDLFGSDRIADLSGDRSLYQQSFLSWLA